jgi:hypothetical protein
MKQKKQPFFSVAGILRFLASDRFFWILFGLFLLQAVWIALSGAFSMAYDEYVHYGAATFYSQHWLPFLSSQPLSADAFGAVTRDTSYFYHYLMSFPLRLFSELWPNLMAQIIFLRLCDIAFFAGGILLFRRAFRVARFSALHSNIALGFFMVLPVTPFLAAQVNYDTLIFLLMGVNTLLAVQVVQQLREHKRFPVFTGLWLLSLSMLAAIVKYAYAPILLGLAIYLAISVYKTFGFRPKQLAAALRSGMYTGPRWRLVVAIVFFALSFGLFAERYGVNTLRYHTPTPECNQVMSLERCQAYAPFARNHAYAVGNYDLPASKIAQYPFQNWIRGMLRSLFFAVSSKENGYRAGEPLPAAYVLAYVVMVGGWLLVIVRTRWLWRQNYANQLFIVVAGVYVAVLFTQNFTDFLNLAVPVAIQGRYLVPILPLFLILVTQAAASLLRRYDPRVAVGSMAVLAVLVVQSGGMLPFLVRSDDNWLWNAPVVREVNSTAREIVRPFIVGE